MVIQIKEYRLIRRVALILAIAFYLFIATGCSSKYEPKQAVEGVFTPNQCVRLKGRNVSMEAYLYTICKPQRVTEIGFITGLWEKYSGLEVGRLELQNEDVYIDTESLRQYGKLEYRERESTFDDWRRNHPWGIVGIALGGIIVVLVIALAIGSARSQSNQARQRMIAEAAAALEAELSHKKAEQLAKEAARTAVLTRLKQFAFDAQNSAGSLPIILAEAEILLDKAEERLRSQKPSLFWETIEHAITKLGAFQTALSSIDTHRNAYKDLAGQAEGDVPPFALGVSILPDPTGTHSRLNTLFENAHSAKDYPDFQTIYEQRRTTASIQSLERAIHGVGDRIIDETRRLANSIDCGIGSLQSSLESGAADSSRQSAAILAELQHSRELSEADRSQRRKQADSLAESETLKLRMLNNLQRRKVPKPWEGP